MTETYAAVRYKLSLTRRVGGNGARRVFVLAGGYNICDIFTEKLNLILPSFSSILQQLQVFWMLIKKSSNFKLLSMPPLRFMSSFYLDPRSLFLLRLIPPLRGNPTNTRKTFVPPSTFGQWFSTIITACKTCPHPPPSFHPLLLFLAISVPVCIKMKFKVRCMTST